MKAPMSRSVRAPDGFVFAIFIKVYRANIDSCSCQWARELHDSLFRLLYRRREVDWRVRKESGCYESCEHNLRYQVCGPLQPGELYTSAKVSPGVSLDVDMTILPSRKISNHGHLRSLIMVVTRLFKCNILVKPRHSRHKKSPLWFSERFEEYR